MQRREKKSATAGAVFCVYLKATIRYPWLVFFMLCGVVGIQFASLIAPLYLKQLFNILAISTPSKAAAAQLIGVIGGIALWWFVRWTANRVEHLFNLRVITYVMADLTASTFSYLIDHSYNFFTSNFAGSLTHKVNKFSKAFQVMYESIVMTFLPAALFASGAVGVLFVHNRILGLALGVWVIVFVAFQTWVTNLRQPLRRARSEADTKITATLADAIGNQSTITLFSGSIHEQGLFSKVINVWSKASVRSWTADALIWSGVGLLIIAIEVGLLYGAVIFWEQGILTIGDFVLIQAYLLTLFDRLTAIQSDLRRVYDAFADGEEMLEILNKPHEVKDIRNAKPLSVLEGNISFKNISFFFHDQTPVLEHFNLTVAPGEKLALVGPSGAGKSTITKLLLRLFDVKSGSIEIDGQNIAEVTQTSVRDAIAFVPQEPVLFHRTLMENIRYGRREASDGEVLEAARKAHCHEFISALPEKYNTFVGERGIKLSGGERQRVAIARAILKNSPILVLDEATSSLDSESEALIQDALKTLMEGKTVIVIAYRLSTIMKMDRIVVLQEGTIVADGTHAELLEHKGLYHKLWSIQAGGFLVDADDLESGESLLH